MAGRDGEQRWRARPALSRRALLQSLVASASAMQAPSALAASPRCTGVAPAPVTAPPLPPGSRPLGDLAREAGILFGIAVDFDKTHLADGPQGSGFYDPVFRDIVRRERFDILAYDQAFIFGNVAAAPPDAAGDLVFKSPTLDGWYEAHDATPFIRSTGARARIDSVIWNSVDSAPRWMKPLPARDDWQADAAYRFNVGAMDRYIPHAFAKMHEIARGDRAFIHSIGIVNEPIEHRPGDGSIWANGPFLSWRGTPPVAQATRVPDYMERALLAADLQRRAVLRNDAKIYINDTSDGSDPSTLRMIDLVQKQKLPLDAIGLECHWQPGTFADPWKPDWSTFGRLLDGISSRGLDIYITELDVLDYWAFCSAGKVGAAESDRMTSLYFRSFLDEVLRHRAVKMVTCFTPVDRWSWYRGIDVARWVAGQGEAAAGHCSVPPNAADVACARTGLYDEVLRAKPARAAVAAALQGARR